MQGLYLVGRQVSFAKDAALGGIGYCDGHTGMVHGQHGNWQHTESAGLVSVDLRLGQEVCTISA